MGAAPSPRERTRRGRAGAFAARRRAIPACRAARRARLSRDALRRVQRGQVVLRQRTPGREPPARLAEPDDRRYPEDPARDEGKAAWHGARPPEGRSDAARRSEPRSRALRARGEDSRGSARARRGRADESERPAPAAGLPARLREGARDVRGQGGRVARLHARRLRRLRGRRGQGMLRRGDRDL